MVLGCSVTSAVLFVPCLSRYDRLVLAPSANSQRILEILRLLQLPSTKLPKARTYGSTRQLVKARDWSDLFDTALNPEQSLSQYLCIRVRVGSYRAVLLHRMILWKPCISSANTNEAAAKSTVTWIRSNRTVATRGDPMGLGSVGTRGDAQK